jgi:acetate kinase
MDTTLTVNPGSASKKYTLYKEGVLVLAVTFEKISEEYGKCVEVNGERQRCEEVSPQEYARSLREVLTIIRDERILNDEHEIARVGVRIVAPGTFFQTHRVIDARYMENLQDVQQAAPLHVTSMLDELKILRELLPKAMLVGVSDSAFHSTIPEYARTYSIPYEDTTELDIYRFGYHGLSVSSVAKKLGAQLGVMPERAIVCHIGSGVSVTALRAGKSIETSMGFSPASGLMMGTRAGNIDPGALLYILEKRIMGPVEAHAYLNREGGLRGILGHGDLRIALERMEKGDKRATLAVQMYTYGIKKQIGASIAALGGLDALVLTATAVERNPVVRTLICDGLEPFGMVLDADKNEQLVNRSGSIGATESAVRIEVISTDEMREIADIAASM